MAAPTRLCNWFVLSKERIVERKDPPIREGHGRLPWWIWAAIAVWLVYAFLLGPFDWFSPVR